MAAEQARDIAQKAASAAAEQLQATRDSLTQAEAEAAAAVRQAERAEAATISGSSMDAEQVSQLQAQVRELNGSLQIAQSGRQAALREF